MQTRSHTYCVGSWNVKDLLLSQSSDVIPPHITRSRARRGCPWENDIESSHDPDRDM